MRKIDADALIMRLSDWALGASQNESDRGETRALRQREYDTIEHCVGVIVSAPTVDDWISVKDRLPKKSGYLLVYKSNGFMAVAKFQSRGKRTHWGKGNCKITHWMPLPEPPEEVSGDD